MENIAELLDLSEDNLLQLIGVVYASSEKIPGLSVHEHLRMAGFLWFRQHWESLYFRICRRWKYCENQQAIQQRPLTEQIAMISEIITELFEDTRVPAAVAAALLVKRGLEQFCDCTHTSSLMERREQIKRYIALPKTVNLDVFFVSTPSPEDTG